MLYVLAISHSRRCTIFAVRVPLSAVKDARGLAAVKDGQQRKVGAFHSGFFMPKNDSSDEIAGFGPPGKLLNT
ncbi:hypothetical protein LguiB_022730 [Lonicera macranthoides]